MLSPHNTHTGSIHVFSVYDMSELYYSSDIKALHVFFLIASITVLVMAYCYIVSCLVVGSTSW